jgi:hypothetical protein
MMVDIHIKDKLALANLRTGFCRDQSAFKEVPFLPSICLKVPFGAIGFLGLKR